MAYSLNGIGTKFYGERDRREDHSYVTTEWLVIFDIPVLPIRSLRVKESGAPSAYKQGFRIGFGETSHYLVLEKTFPNWRQVLFTYSFVLFCVGWATAIFWVGLTIEGFVEHLGYHDFAPVVCVAFILSSIWVPAIIPGRLRDLADRRAGLNGYPKYKDFLPSRRN